MKYLNDKNIEKEFLKLAIKKIRNLCTTFKMQTKLWPSTIYYRVDNNNNLSFLDIYDGDTGGDLVYYVKEGKPYLKSINDEIQEKISSGISGKQAQKAFINGLFNAASEALKEKLIKEDYFPY